MLKQDTTFKKNGSTYMQCQTGKYIDGKLIGLQGIVGGWLGAMSSGTGFFWRVISVFQNVTDGDVIPNIQKLLSCTL